MPRYYPIMLDVRERLALVIGGDQVAAEKAANLAASGANVTVLSPQFNNELYALAQQHKVRLKQKAYEQGDLEGAFVVVAATTYDAALTEAIWQEAQERNQLLNVVDVPTRCNFILPSILRRDQLTIAVSTEGASPSLAKRIRQQLERLFPPAYGLYLRLAALVRSYIRQQGLSYEQRDAFFGDFYDSQVLHHLASGDEEQALAETQQLLKTYDIDLPEETLRAEFGKAG
ncbi:MAG TPA: bifunctional precorrin-2 dehydrogenase/sirohydrochlorin ferrochelatase [Ktedonobacteraceae bacterium]